jgi:hypothetical protein|eukprot:SAG25_NODE_3_length_30426_cov_8.268210_37_plen_40_part_00
MVATKGHDPPFGVFYKLKSEGFFLRPDDISALVRHAPLN